MGWVSPYRERSGLTQSSQFLFGFFEAYIVRFGEVVASGAQLHAGPSSYFLTKHHMKSCKYNLLLSRGSVFMNKITRHLAVLLLALGLGCSGDASVPAAPDEPETSEPTPDSRLPEGNNADDDDSSAVGSEGDEGADDPSSPPSDHDDGSEPELEADPRRSAGCDGGSDDAPTGERFLDLSGATRRYQVRLPDNYDSSRAYPMLFSLHGLNETGDTPMRQFENVINEEGIEVFPDGEGEQWNYTTDMDFIDALLTELQGEYCVDPARVFAAGFSAGGGGTHAIGCFLGDRFRGIAALAGTGTFTECEGRVAVMQIQGTSDFVAREEAAAAIREHWIAVNQCEDSDNTQPSAYDRCDAFVGCMEDYPTLYCEHSGGHEWPSWSNPIIWDFFMGLDPIAPGEDPEEGNDGVQASSVTFTLAIPPDFVGTPIKLAPILYGANTFQPIFVAPTLILNNGMPVGDEFVLGEQVQYEVSPINLAGLDLPRDYTFTVVVYVEGGGDPTPCGKDWIGLEQITIEASGDLVVDQPLTLEPFMAIPFFFDCPEE